MNFLFYLAVGTIAPLVTYYMSLKGLSPFLIGIIVAVATLFGSLAAMLIGRVSDTIGRKNFLYLSILLFFTASVLFPFSESSIEFFIDALCYYPSFSITTALVIAMFFDSINEAQGTKFGKFRISGSIGWILGNLISSYITVHFPITYTFRFATLWATLGLILLLFIHENRRPSEELRRIKSSITRNLNIISLFKNLSESTTGFSLILLALLLFFFYSYIASSLGTFLPVYMRLDFKAPSFLVSLTFALMATAEIPAMIYFGKLSDKIGRLPVLLLSLLAYPIRLIITGFSTNLYLIIGIQLLHGLTFGAFFVVNMSLLNDYTPKEYRGFVIGVSAIFQTIGSILGSSINGYIISLYGFKIMYLSVAFISLLPIILVITNLRKRKIS